MLLISVTDHVTACCSTVGTVQVESAAQATLVESPSVSRYLMIRPALARGRHTNVVAWNRAPKTVVSKLQKNAPAG